MLKILLLICACVCVCVLFILGSLVLNGWSDEIDDLILFFTKLPSSFDLNIANVQLESTCSVFRSWEIVHVFTSSPFWIKSLLENDQRQNYLNWMFSTASQRLQIIESNLKCHQLQKVQDVKWSFKWDSKTHSRLNSHVDCSLIILIFSHTLLKLSQACSNVMKWNGIINGTIASFILHHFFLKFVNDSMEIPSKNKLIDQLRLSNWSVLLSLLKQTNSYFGIKFLATKVVDCRSDQSFSFTWNWIQMMWNYARVLSTILRKSMDRCWKCNLKGKCIVCENEQFMLKYFLVD